MILYKEIMNYKEQIKDNQLITKFKIIKDFKIHWLSKVEIAYKYSMHRNCVFNIIKSFDCNIDPWIKEKLLSSSNNLTKIELENMLTWIKSKSRKPKGNRRSASREQEDLVLEYHSNWWNIWYKRMDMIIKRWLSKVEWINTDKITKLDNFNKNIKDLKWLTFSQIKWIYRRNWLKSRKIKSSKWKRVSLYDYKAIWCFEYMHIDTKDILDKKALPESIYKKFKLSKALPIIEWNIIDVKSRFRFIGYSHKRTSMFWLNFLVFAIQYLRSNNIISEDLKITIWTDNWSEFYSWSKIKEKKWNDILWILNANIYSYNPWFDIRKNLIERSHKTDDEEFFIPRWPFINNERSFILEARWYSYYFNNKRFHSWIEMNNMTPIEKLKSCWVYNADKLLNFPLMILEDTIWEILKTTAVIRLLWFIINDKKNKIMCIEEENIAIKKQEVNEWLKQWTLEIKRLNFNQKYIMKLKANFSEIDFDKNLWIFFTFEESAHYVLTYYHPEVFQMKY